MSSRISLCRGKILTTYSYLMMQALAEMAVMYPVNGAFTMYIVKFIDPSWGFACGWQYGVSWLTVLPFEISAACNVSMVMPTSELYLTRERLFITGRVLRMSTIAPGLFRFLLLLLSSNSLGSKAMERWDTAIHCLVRSKYLAYHLRSSSFLVAWRLLPALGSWY